MLLVTTEAGEAVTRGWTDGLPHRDHTPQSLATNTHTHTLLREGPTGHETHQRGLSTSSHSNATIKERSRGQPPTSKWCLSAQMRGLYSFHSPQHHFLFPELTGHPVLSFPPLSFITIPTLFAFLRLSADFPWPHSHLDYEGGESNIKRTKVREHLHEVRRSSWKNGVKQMCWILNTMKSFLGCSKTFTTAKGWGSNCSHA